MGPMATRESEEVQLLHQAHPELEIPKLLPVLVICFVCKVYAARLSSPDSPHQTGRTDKGVH